MPLRDDNKDKWVYRPHTEVKHEILEKYLHPWVNKLTTYNEESGDQNKVRVIDCFAGRASYTDIEGTSPREMEHISTPAEVPGSPQIILDRLTSRSGQYDSAECILIERNKNNYNKLNSTIEKTEGYSEKISIEYYNNDFKEIILDIVNTDGQDCPTLFFIDPFGFSDLEYDIITEIGSTGQFELLITFMYRDMNRFLNNYEHQKAMNRVFGEQKWKGEIESYSADNWVPLVEYYSDRIKEGGPERTFEYKITEPESNQTIYYLVFGSNHPNGIRTMRRVMKHCGTGNSFAYAPKDPKYDPNQQKLGTGTDSTKQFLKERFSEYIITFNKLVKISIEERKYKPETESEYREAVHELEDSGEVDVIRITSKNNGIKGSDLVDFHDSDKFLG
ncbi:MAG: three-Cys-motif partner protein TcmP [Candidatus Paceibacteria bacterium]